jgi:antitoxin CptB
MMADEGAVARLKRLRMRSWRRGTREMDLVLGPFADSELAAMGQGELDLYEALLAENDQDLLQWVLGSRPAPGHLADLVARVARAARDRLSGGRNED